jgi:RHS repeat-associated protein
VTVDGNATDRRDSWFRRELNAANASAAVYATNVVTLVSGGVTNSTNVVSFIAKDPEAPEYDDDGNLTKDGRWVYTWTAENRLRKMETRNDLPAGVPNLTMEFKYDYLGRRVQKLVKENGTTTLDRRYMWDGWKMVMELDSSGTVKKGYEWGPDLSHTFEGAGTIGGLLRVTDSGGGWESWMSFPCYDGNGNVMGLIGYATGNILAKYEYDPYGKLIRTQGDATLAESNPFLFSTKFLDRESGLSYYGYRYYDADLGRWVNRDPIGVKGGLNLQAWRGNNIVNSTDLLGLKIIYKHKGKDGVYKDIDSGKDFELFRNKLDSLASRMAGGIGSQLKIAAEADCVLLVVTFDASEGATPNGLMLVYPEPGYEITGYITLVSGAEDFGARPEKPEFPDETSGFAEVLLAHELSHALIDITDPNNVKLVENLARDAFGEKRRDTYKGKSVYDDPRNNEREEAEKLKKFGAKFSDPKTCCNLASGGKKGNGK